MCVIKNIDFETILPIWRDELWPGRQSLIEPVSAISYLGAINMDIQSYQPQFFGLYQGDQLVAVASCHRTSETDMRLRGVWVHADFRGQSLGRKILLHVIEFTKKDQSQRLWGMMRKSSIEVYLKIGFKIVGDTTAFEFGPHYFCEYLF